MGDRYYGSFEAISIQSCETESEKTISTESQQGVIHVTANMVNNLHCARGERESSTHSLVLPLLNAPTPPVSEAGDIDHISHETINYEQTEDLLPNCQHQVMIIFEGGDINCALHFLAQSMENPFDCNSVATVLVEHSLRDEFVNRVVEVMRPMVLEGPAMTKFRSTAEMIERLNIEAISCKCQYPEISPMLVFDCQHAQLAEGTTGVICVRTFKTSSDIVDICLKESLLFSSSSMWNESIEDLYQLVVSLNCTTFYFNCSNVTMEPICAAVATKKIDVCVSDGFHYETLQIDDDLKVVVFPIGGHLCQPPPEKSVMLSPISYLNE